ncbi:Predicted transporter (major facilitator superfamily) [Ceraceosorus bombacis]|uniref:Predicted transporter (Major facilitator superfamily) n=1 Tax=Ceraceosorus bombacis TaxID=401625 RepID=A0A0P1BMA3_9BASI|nr:Predicted transporter (major facilitator superfamily) [Ceraceosorus bombacis]
MPANNMRRPSTPDREAKKEAETESGVHVATNDRDDAEVSDKDSSLNEKDNEKQGDRKLSEQDPNALLANPLKAFSRVEVAERARAWADEAGLGEDRELFARAALVAQNPTRWDEMPELSQEEKDALTFERDHPYRQPKALWLLVLTVSLSAAVQGMDQSAINGSLLFFPEQFGIADRYDGWLTGIISAAPYFSCAVFSFLSSPLNYYFGRRGTIAITCVIAMVTCIWAAVVPSWELLLASRVVLGLGISPKSATTPLYAGECAPAKIRGLLGMQWQTWTAFGIALGQAASLAFYGVPDSRGIEGLNWRLMLGAPAVPPLAVLALVYLSPESPRWYLGKGRKAEAFRSMRRLRNTPLEAARDIYYANELLEAEKHLGANKQRNALLELASVPRNRRAVEGASFVMFMQQFCGINVISYFSSQIFVDAGATPRNALVASFGWGVLNWLAAAPAFISIDKFGRSPGRIGGVAVGIYLHCLAYSPTAGPVPFTYSAESFPLYVRESGMAWAVSVCWFFNGVLSLTWPSMQRNLGSTGAFAFYAGCNGVAFVVAYFFLKETKGLTLEELDSVFGVSNHDHAIYQAGKASYYASRLTGKRASKPEPLYAHEKLSAEERAARGTLAPVAMGH